jgi:leucine dehydrogenase
MSVFTSMSEKDHEQVVYCYDKSSGLRAIIAIHDTTLGPALGGCRLWHYENEAAALRDALRLSRGMTYKAAIAGLNLGGGKTVIMADAHTTKSESMFRSLGRFIEGLAGRYITAEDVGTTVKDMSWVRVETSHVTGLSPALGGLGDPSPITALGVFHGQRAALQHVFGQDTMAGRTVAIQGLGQVGGHLVSHLISAGANVVACDRDSLKIKNILERFSQIKIVSPEEIYDVSCDIFAPCALGGTVNQKTIERLRCPIIAGSANNVLEQEEIDSALLKSKNILYVPDFVISAGGLMSVSVELAHGKRKDALAMATGIFDIVDHVLNTASQENITTQVAALRVAEKRIASIRSLRRH